MRSLAGEATLRVVLGPASLVKLEWAKIGFNCAYIITVIRAGSRRGYNLQVVLAYFAMRAHVTLPIRTRACVYSTRHPHDTASLELNCRGGALLSLVLFRFAYFNYFAWEGRTYAYYI